MTVMALKYDGEHQYDPVSQVANLLSLEAVWGNLRVTDGEVGNWPDGRTSDYNERKQRSERPHQDHDVYP